MTLPSPVQSYTFKTGSHPAVQTGLQRLLELVEPAVSRLLDKLWTDRWIEDVGTSKLKAYKAAGEKQVELTVHVQGRDVAVYLPSRIRRCIAEAAGRILRSQHERKRCFEDVREVLLFTGLEGDLDGLVRTVTRTLQVFKGKYYRWQLVRQTLRLCRRLFFHHGLDIWAVNYTAVVKPRIHRVLLPYSPDDGQAVKYRVTAKKIHYQLKLPDVDLPLSRKDWNWHGESVTIPKKIRKKIKQAAAERPCLPDLRVTGLKGGLQLPVLQFAWEMTGQELDITYFKKERALAVDLGLVNLLTSVVAEAGSQVTPPLFYSVARDYLAKIERMYKLVAKLQRKLATYPATWRGQTRRKVEISRLHAKLNRCRKGQVYLAVKELLHQATVHGCGIIVLEDLRSYLPPAGKKSLSRRLNNWLRGWLIQFLEHKAGSRGIKVITVPARSTSSYCPRCGKIGRKVATTTSTVADDTGRCFWCPHCGYRADRDYVGALNVYRVYRLPVNQRYRLATAKPVFYRKAVPPPNRAGGTPDHPATAG